MPNLHFTGRCFPVSDVRFVHAWARSTPDGWEIGDVTDATNSGDACVFIIPPGADLAVFLVTYDYGCDDVVTLRRLHDRLGGAIIETGRHTSLREAVLGLCPLTPSQMKAVRADLEKPQAGATDTADREAA